MADPTKIPIAPAPPVVHFVPLTLAEIDELVGSIMTHQNEFRLSSDEGWALSDSLLAKLMAYLPPPT